jgi:hypothetical protein
MIEASAPWQAANTRVSSPCALDSVAPHDQAGLAFHRMAVSGRPIAPAATVGPEPPAGGSDGSIIRLGRMRLWLVSKCGRVVISGGWGVVVGTLMGCVLEGTGALEMPPTRATSTAQPGQDFHSIVTTRIPLDGLLALNMMYLGLGWVDPALLDSGLVAWRSGMTRIGCTDMDVLMLKYPLVSCSKSSFLSLWVFPACVLRP